MCRGETCQVARANAAKRTEWQLGVCHQRTCETVETARKGRTCVSEQHETEEQIVPALRAANARDSEVSTILTAFSSMSMHCSPSYLKLLHYQRHVRIHTCPEVGRIEKYRLTRYVSVST